MLWIYIVACAIALVSGAIFSDRLQLANAGDTPAPAEQLITQVCSIAAFIAFWLAIIGLFSGSQTMIFMAKLLATPFCMLIATSVGGIAKKQLIRG